MTCTHLLLAVRRHVAIAGRLGCWEAQGHPRAQRQIRAPLLLQKRRAGLRVEQKVSAALGMGGVGSGPNHPFAHLSNQLGC